MPRYCSVYGCFETTFGNKQRRFFRFPKDENRCRDWITAIGRNDLEHKDLKILNNHYFVCELHFDPSECHGKYLKRVAVPTLSLPQLEDLDNFSGLSKYTQTDFNLTYSACNSLISQSSESVQTSEHTNIQTLSEHTPRKTKLQVKRKSEIKKQKLLEPEKECVSDAKNLDLSPLLKKIIEAQNVLKRDCKGDTYDQECIMFALNMYFASPGAYQFLSKILCLPNERALQRHIASGISTKFDESVIKCLQLKSRNMSESEKCCIICADEISLKRHLHYQINKDKVVGLHEINGKQNKEIATQAFVVMARGIMSNWKQPLAFCFLSKSEKIAELSMWLVSIIATMIEIGFNVCAFVSNQGSNLEQARMAKRYSVTADKPFFFVNGRKIYYIFDVPHLIKSLRNNLIYYDFVYHDDNGSEQVASWDDVERMYDIEKSKKYKMAFKLTDSHIRPNSFERMHVKYATQVLSRTVAVAISSLVESSKLPEKSMGTVKFIELINDTFDILNSSSVCDDYLYKNAFYQADYQINTLVKVQKILSELRVIHRSNGIDVARKIKFVNGFLISIKAILNLADDLKTAGYDYLYTRRLNQDPLVIFFGKVKQQGGKCREPTAIQFLTAFKKLFLLNVIRYSEPSNCAEDVNQLLKSVEEAQSATRSRENESLDSGCSLTVGTEDYRFELPEENAFTYICGYLIKKCYENHKNCEIMKNYIISNGEVTNNMFVDFKAPEEFKQYIKAIDMICEHHLVYCDFYHVGHEIMTKIKEVVFNLPCPCFPLEFLKKLYIRFRIFNVMRHNNRNFKGKSFKRKYFSVSHIDETK